MTGNFSKNGYTIQETSTGLTITPDGGTAISIVIPDYNSLGIDYADTDTFHRYVTTAKVGDDDWTSSSIVWENLQEEPFPTFGLFDTTTPVTNGSQSEVPGLGTVTHYVDQTNHIVVNVTDDDHLLAPGIVVRYFYEDNGSFYITTIGFGNGDYGGLNQFFSDWVWNENDARIARESLWESEHPTLAPQAPFGPPEPYGPWVTGTTIPFGQGEAAGSPLVLDVDGSGTIELAALNGTGSVMWDIDQDGFREASGWITGGDGLLCIDLNSDGVINDHGELFGGTNGYSALAAYDTNSSGTITSADTQFADLRVWTDDNADGYSQSSELHTLSSLGITSIAVTYSNVNYDIAGNHISYQSTFVMNGNTYTSADAFFAYDNVNSEYDGDYTLDSRVLALPTLRGYGELPDLHIAMSNDEDLLEMVQDFVALDMTEMVAAAFDSTTGPIADILFRWAGVDGVSPSSRGGLIDARIVEFLETFVGDDYSSASGPNPISGAIPFLLQAWGNACDGLATRLAYQVMGGHDLFTENSFYNPIADTFDNSTSIDFSALEDFLDGEDTATGKIGIAKLIVGIVEETVGIGNLSQQDHDDLQDLMPYGLTVEALSSPIFGEGTIAGDSNDNLLIGGSGTQNLYGYAGNDILVGHSDLDGLVGGQGNDTYLFRLGDASTLNDEIVSESTGQGTDKIIFGAGINPDDVFSWTTNVGTLFLQYSANDRISVSGGITQQSGAYTTNTVGQYLEQVLFDDGTVWDLTAGLHLHNNNTGRALYGSAYADTLEGGTDTDDLYGHAGNDTLVGHVGSDGLTGGAGNDSYVFSLGDSAVFENPDYVNEATSGGTDQIVFNSGIDPNDVRLWTDTSGTLTIQYSANDFIHVAGGVSHLTGAYNTNIVGQYLEQIVFNDSTVWDLTAGLHLHNNDTGRAVYGSAYADLIEGGTGDDSLYGYDGNDTLIGGSGNDGLLGGNGDDLLYSGAGDDYFEGGANTDTVTYVNAASAVTVSLATGSASGEGADTFSGVENLVGSAYGDTLTGSTGANTIWGGAGNDTISGGNGNDILYGGAGTDSLTGGNGADTFVFELLSAFSNQDTIADFSTAQGDKIDISNVIEDFNPVTDAIANWVDFTNSGGNSIMSIDRDGTGTTYGFANVATISGVTNLDETTLYNNGNLLAA